MFNVVNQDDLRKWVRFVLSCGVAAFVSYWGVFATAGGGMLWAGSSPSVALAGGIFAGAGAMAAAVLATAKASPLWPELTVLISKASSTPNPESRIPSPEDPAARPPALTG